MNHLESLTEEALISLWHKETHTAELTDNWEYICAIEEEMVRRGMDPAAEADPSWVG